MSCMSLACFVKLNDLTPLQNIQAVSVYLSKGHDWSPIRLIHCMTVLVNAQFLHTFIMCRYMQKKLVIGLDIQKIHHVGCDLTDNGHMFFYWGVDILITSTDIAIREQQFHTISNVEVPAHSIVMISRRKSGLVSHTYHVCMNYKFMKY